MKMKPEHIGRYVTDFTLADGRYPFQSGTKQANQQKGSGADLSGIAIFLEQQGLLFIPQTIFLKENPTKQTGVCGFAPHPH